MRAALAEQHLAAMAVQAAWRGSQQRRSFLAIRTAAVQVLIIIACWACLETHGQTQ